MSSIREPEMRRTLSLLCILGVVGCATAPAPAPAVDPLGVFEFTTVVQGETVSGTFRIDSNAGEYVGSIMASGLPAMPILDLKVDGQWLSIRSNTGQNVLEISVAFVGDTFTGEWFSRDQAGQVQDTGTLSGRRRMGTDGGPRVTIAH